MTPNTINILEQISTLFASRQNITCAVLFGSRALERERLGSDIDLAIKWDISSHDILDMKLAYDDLYLPYRIDIIAYDTISNPALRDHIDRVGKVIFEKR